MGNWMTDMLGKVAGNVTQSVASALIVTAITTYLLVSPGKKDAGGTAADSTKVGTPASSGEEPKAGGDAKHSAQQSTETTTSEKIPAGGAVNLGASTKEAPATSAKQTAVQETLESPATTAATKAYKELQPETPAEQKLERTITEGRAKGDSLLKAHPQEEKAKEVKLETKKDVKDVKKRADDVFDELDQEVGKKPEQ